MRNLKYLIFSSLLISFLLTGCSHDLNDNETRNAGFIDYQYDYILVQDSVSKAKQSYKRANLSEASFALYKINNLPDSLQERGLRKVELYLHSENYNLDKSEMEQSIGASMVHITLVDSLAFESNLNQVLVFNYVIQSENYLNIRKRPACLGIKVKMNMIEDTLTHQVDYKYKFFGELSKTVRVLSLGNNSYQIIATGLADSKNYNLYYIGKINRNKDIEIQ